MVLKKSYSFLDETTWLPTGRIQRKRRESYLNIWKHEEKWTWKFMQTFNVFLGNVFAVRVSILCSDPNGLWSKYLSDDRVEYSDSTILYAAVAATVWHLIAFNFIGCSRMWCMHSNVNINTFQLNVEHRKQAEL